MYQDYSLLLNDQGWGYLHHGTDGNFPLNEMEWKKVALLSETGRVCVRTKSTKTVSGEVIPGKSVWLDASHTLFVHKTLQISLSLSIALYEFTYNDKSTLKAFEGHGEQYPLPPRTFWDGPNGSPPH